MQLSVIVVNWNTRDLLHQCLDSIMSTVTGTEFEIIVVDNNSADGSTEMVASNFPHVTLISNSENVGFARANNQAIRISQGQYVLLLNSDAVLLPNAASAMISVLDYHPQIGIVGAQLLNPDGSFQGSFADFPSLKGELLLAIRLARLIYSAEYPHYPEALSQQERLVEWVSGACLMARMSAIGRVGVLDEDYFMYSEETDWCYRMRQAGWGVYYQPLARVVHWIGQSSNRVPERRRSQVYGSKWLFMRKHRSPLIANCFRTALLIASALKLIMWTGRSVDPNRDTRTIARQHVRSYRLVLGKLMKAGI